MKNMIRAIFLTLCLFLGCSTQVSAQEAFLIDDLNVYMKVHEDGRIDIIEKYNLDFTTYRHGFYRNIPTLYHMKWTIRDEVVNKDYFFPVKDIKCSTQCEVDGSSEGMQIKLGDPDRQVYGKQEYIISYSVYTKDLDIDVDGQMLYWNLLSDFDTTTKHLSFKIEMPKTFDEKEVFTSSGSYGENRQDISFNVKGKTITGETINELSNNEAATIKVNLPKNYFVYPQPQDTSWFGIGTGLVCLLIAGGLFLKFGKDDDVIVSVEFKAPDGLDSASVGYVIDDTVDNKDILSLIIEWANQGYLKIEDREEGFQLIKLKELEPEARKYQTVFFQALFKDSDTVDSAMLKTMNVRNSLMNAKSLLRNYFANTKKRRIYTRTSMGMQIVMIFLIMLPSFVLTLANGNEKFDLVGIYAPYLIPSILLGVSCIPWIFLMRKHYVLKRSVLILSFVSMLLLNGFLLAATVISQVMLDGSVIAALLTAVCQLGMIIFMIFMDKRTPQGNRWLGQILGLREFILSCEKDRLELLVEENPSAFYEILPYAYVLGVSDIWVKKFETIVIPEPIWYSGYGYGNGNVFMTMLWWNHFHYCFRDISSAATYIPPSTSGKGGGSFGSGGFGGGGFSGGGFGGGGGGSW